MGSWLNIFNILVHIIQEVTNWTGKHVGLLKARSLDGHHGKM